MFIAHYGVAFGAKLASPKTSLGTLFLASAFIDLLWPTFLLLGMEQVRIAPGITAVTPLEFAHYPYSHSLAAVLIWAGVLGAAYGWHTGERRGVAVLAALVVSHWLLDAVAHRPDLPLVPTGQWYAGLELWWSLPATLAAELLLFGTGLTLYGWATRARDGAGRIALAALALLLLFIYMGSLWGPPPPSAEAVAWAGQAQWLFVIAAYWLDRHRSFVN